MRLKKKYLLLPVVTLAVILLCFLLPSILFQIYDQEWTGKRVENPPMPPGSASTACHSVRKSL